jgi:hypothetical protein
MDAADAITWAGIGETESGEPMAATHVAKSWYAAHGADSLLTRHFSTDFITYAQLQTELTTGGGYFNGAFDINLPYDTVSDTFAVWLYDSEANFQSNLPIYWGFTVKIGTGGSTLYQHRTITVDYGGTPHNLNGYYAYEYATVQEEP